MASIKWALVLLFISVVCSAQKRGCKNMMKGNTLVKDQEWVCTYPNGRVTISGNFTLNQDIQVHDLMVIAKLSGLYQGTTRSWDIYQVVVNLCNEYKGNWLGNWRKFRKYTDIQSICDKTTTLVKDKTYHVKKWEVDATFADYFPVNWFVVDVKIATPEEMLFHMKFMYYQKSDLAGIF